jgi:hypothetical protein
MAYCNVADVSRILPENVLIGNRNIGVPSPGRIGNQGSNRSNLSPEEAERYIQYATSYLDGRLRPFYACPLRRVKVFETEILSDIVAGSNVVVLVHDSGSFIRGNLVRVQGLYDMETATVIDTPTLTTVRLDRIYINYSSINSKISILQYPDPVPLVTAQMAASIILDRIYVSQNSPDVSSFAIALRNLARSQIENIMSGEVMLFGQETTGRRFIRMNLLDRWSSPAEIQKGVDKE